ncbi:unnamed protein product [Amoebophrya sp. A25]|nr:unnamed protein product [Amoebophrya sp. A25]|eukprot:GSA25T00008498001.1
MPPWVRRDMQHLNATSSSTRVYHYSSAVEQLGVDRSEGAGGDQSNTSIVVDPRNATGEPSPPTSNNTAGPAARLSLAAFIQEEVARQRLETERFLHAQREALERTRQRIIDAQIQRLLGEERTFRRRQRRREQGRGTAAEEERSVKHATSSASSLEDKTSYTMNSEQRSDIVATSTHTSAGAVRIIDKGDHADDHRLGESEYSGSSSSDESVVEVEIRYRHIHHHQHLHHYRQLVFPALTLNGAASDHVYSASSSSSNEKNKTIKKAPHLLHAGIPTSVAETSNDAVSSFTSPSNAVSGIARSEGADAIRNGHALRALHSAPTSAAPTPRDAAGRSVATTPRLEEQRDTATSANISTMNNHKTPKFHAPPRPKNPRPKAAGFRTRPTKGLFLLGSKTQQASSSQPSSGRATTRMLAQEKSSGASSPGLASSPSGAELQAPGGHHGASGVRDARATVVMQDPSPSRGRATVVSVVREDEDMRCSIDMTKNRSACIGENDQLQQKKRSVSASSSCSRTRSSAGWEVGKQPGSNSTTPRAVDEGDHTEENHIREKPTVVVDSIHVPPYVPKKGYFRAIRYRDFQTTERPAERRPEEAKRLYGKHEHHHVHVHVNVVTSKRAPPSGGTK